MHGTALQSAGTQDAHGRRPAGRGFRELEPDLLPALFPHAGRPPEPGGVPLTGTPRPLQGRPARTAGAAGRRSHVLRGFGAADALSARRIHARPGARLRIPGGQIRHRTAGGRSLGTGRSSPRQPSRTASGAGGGVLHTGRIRNGTRHVMPHGGGYPAAVLHRSVGLLAHAPHPGDRKRRTPQAFGSIQGQYHRHQPRFRPAIRLWQRHRARNAARQRPHAARTRAFRSATRSNRRRCCNSPRNTALQNAVRNAPSDGASCKA